MSKIIQRVLIDTNNVRPQHLPTYGGRIVFVAEDPHSPGKLALYFEADKDARSKGESPDRTFMVLFTGMEPPPNYEYVISASVRSDDEHHIYQWAEAKDEPKQDVLSEYGQATTLSYDVALHKNRDLVMVAQVSATGALDLLNKYTEAGLTPQTRAEYMQALRVEGHGETFGHMVDGQLYSMKFTKIGV